MSLLGTVIGDYKILKKIGEGGMGVVYQGVHVRLEQLVAIKDLSPELASNSEMRERFIREAKIQAKLNHPNVVNVHNLLERDGRLFLVMEFVEGQTLDKIIQEKGAMPPATATRITRQVLEALAFMHSKGVIHRDLKPGNIMITPEGHVKVTDFGIAKATTEQGHTRAGVRLGTLWYMSPEQIKGKSVDARSDLYAMGITLFQMVTGKLPFFGNSDFEIMKAHAETPPPDPKKIKKDIPKPLAVIILKLLEKDPAKRYSSAAEVLKDLDSLGATPEKKPKSSIPSPEKASEGGIKKGTGSFLQATGKKVSPLIWIIIAILLLGATIVVVTYWFMNRKKSIIPVVKAPAIEKKVQETSPPSPPPKKAEKKTGLEGNGSVKPAAEGSSEENVTPVLEEIEKSVGKPESGEGEEKRETSPPSVETAPEGEIVEMTPSGEYKKDQEETVVPQENVQKKQPRKPEHKVTSTSSGESPRGGTVVEMTPSGELKESSEKTRESGTGTQKTRQKHKRRPVAKKSKKRKPSQKIKEGSEGTYSTEQQIKKQSPPQQHEKKAKKKENETLTIDKQIGHFFKSIKKSLKDLEHPSGSKHTGKKNAEPENNDKPVGFEGAFPRN